MKIVMIHGQNHKGSTYNIGRMIANKIGREEDVVEFFKGFLEYEVYLLTIILLGITFVVMMFALIKYAIVFKNLLKEKRNIK